MLEWLALDNHTAATTDDGSGLLTVIVLAAVGILVSLVFFFATRYKICPSDKVMVIYGRVGKGKVAETVHGGGRLIYPLIQNSAFLDLKDLTRSCGTDNTGIIQLIIPIIFIIMIMLINWRHF